MPSKYIILETNTTEQPQVINSYPLAINFDSFQPVTNGFLPAPFTRSAKTQNNLGQLDYRSQPSKRMRLNPVPSYQKRSQIVVPLASPQSPTMSNPELRVQSSGTYSNYQRRTLNSDLSGTNGQGSEVSNKDPIDGSNPNGNTSDSANVDIKRLLLIRQKMIDMQGRTNVSIEDTNWKIAASCLSNQFGNQFIRNKDVKCASSQIVLSISRMQRAGCKSCEA